MINLKNPTMLDTELRDTAKEFNRYHSDMEFYLEAYEQNVFYAPKDYESIKKKVGVNFLEIFADKLHDYLAPFPKVTVPSIPEDRQGCSNREKLLLSTWYYNDGDELWSDSMKDGVILSAVITALEYNFDTKMVDIKRIDPRRAYWRKVDAANKKLDVFWYVEPMTKAQIKEQYGVEPKTRGLSLHELGDLGVSPESNAEYYAVVTRVDNVSVTKWCGDKLLVTPYNHRMGTLPVKVTFPLKNPSYNYRGKFYLKKVTELQAEFNDLWRQRANIVRKLGNPTVWGRGIKQKQFQPVKDSMSIDGGFVGLTENGELGILTVPETAMIDNAIQDCFARMQDKAGFPPVTFGAPAGANTSGDAVGSYFQPTTKMVEKIQVNLKTHLESVNSMILRLYDTFMVTGEPMQLYGYVPQGVMAYQQSEEGEETPSLQRSYQGEVTKADIAGNYYNCAIFSPVAPKDEVSYLRLMFDAAREKIISRSTFYDKAGIISPEDEAAMLYEEQSNPVLNPQGTQQIMQGAQQAQQLQQAGMGGMPDQMGGGQPPTAIPPVAAPPIGA